MKLPEVSIMIPTYNQGNIVHNAIESAMAQDYPNLEIIVSDDCSTDNTQAVIERYLKDTRIKYFKNERNLGRVGNYKKTLENNTRGEWVVNLDGDDVLIDNHYISEVIDLIQWHKDQNIVFAQGGKVTCINGKNKESLPNISHPYQVMKGKEYFLSFYPKSAYFSHIATLYKRDIAVNIDFYRYDISSTDRESFLRLALHGDVLLIKKPYGKWIYYGNNFSYNLDFDKHKKNLAYISESYQYALIRGINVEKLERWRSQLTAIYFENWLYKISTSKDILFFKILKLREYFQFMGAYRPQLLLNKKILLSIGMMPYRLIKSFFLRRRNL